MSRGESRDPQEATCWLNYRGDVRSGVPAVMGPSLNGELLYSVDAEYDPEADRTRVGFSKVAPGGAS